VLVAALGFSGTACSVYKAGLQPGPADLTGPDSDVTKAARLGTSVVGGAAVGGVGEAAFLEGGETGLGEAGAVQSVAAGYGAPAGAGTAGAVEGAKPSFYVNSAAAGGMGDAAFADGGSIVDPVYFGFDDAASTGVAPYRLSPAVASPAAVNETKYEFEFDAMNRIGQKQVS